MQYLFCGGFQEITLSDPLWPAELEGEGAVRFHDVPEASSFLRRIAGDADAMPRLRELLARAATSPYRHVTDDEVIAELADKLRAGTIRVDVRTRMRPTPGGHVEEKEEEALPPREEKADQDVEFAITDLFDDPFPGLEWVLTYPDGATKKSGKLGADGIVKESYVPPGNYQLTFKIVSAARWGAPSIEVGTPVKLTAQAAGFDPGTAGKFEIFCARAADQKPLAKLNGTVNGARVLEATWTPDEAALKDVPGSSLAFRAKIGASHATSAPARVFVKHVIDLSDESGPLADTAVTARFSDGHEETATSKGGKLELLVPVGRQLVWVHLPEHAGAQLTIEPEGEDAHEYALPPSDDVAAGAGDDAGGEEDEASEDEADEDEDDDDDDDDEDHDGDDGDDGDDEDAAA